MGHATSEKKTDLPIKRRKPESIGAEKLFGVFRL
jgi:hypothetical protein